MGVHVLTTEWGAVKGVQAQGILRGSSRHGPKAGCLSPSVIWTYHHSVIQQTLVRGLHGPSHQTSFLTSWSTRVRERDAEQMPA